jgi:kinesin family member 5
MQSTQKQIYDTAAKPIIDSVLEGFNGTIFAYGQTSSGKTHTMTGPNVENIDQQGIIPRMVRTVFTRIESAQDTIEFQVKVSMIEIYMEKIRDLLDTSKTDLKIHEEKGKGVYMADLTEQYISDEREVFQTMK